MLPAWLGPECFSIPPDRDAVRLALIAGSDDVSFEPKIPREH
jgi:hypothetical protein